MSDAFVPFAVKTSVAKSAEPFRAKIVSAPQAAAVPFKPAAMPALAPTPHPQHGQPQVSVTRDGDKIISISVTCGCGEVMVLQCVY